ncbi:MAG: SagB/ThcOx family dehydrogenase [Desulfobacterales bacterium]|jgi:SagB-type dehydrogenase family enzyme
MQTLISEKVSEIINYHEATKHHYDRYARSPGYMDWQNQPNPFRAYAGAPALPLPLLKNDPTAAHRDLYDRKKNPTRPLAIETLAGFLELSLGLSAWKAASGSRWSLRINPSSGNLHPTEAHLILPPLNSKHNGVYHYNALGHMLEKRAEVPAELWQRIISHFGIEGFLIGTSSIFWRESWKYGERAFRYCNHDAGHALACISFAANLFGWQATCLNSLSDDAIQTVLGFDQVRFRQLEEEHPDFLCFIHPLTAFRIPRDLPDQIISEFADLAFVGEPDPLSQTVVNWEIIYQTARQTFKPATADITVKLKDRKWFGDEPRQLCAAEIIRNRRSATDFDRNGSITRNQFLSILDKTLPRVDCAPFDAELMDTSIHLLLFVHNVADMAAGLYFFCRRDSDFDEIRRVSRSDFLWEPVETDFPLYLLSEGNYRQQATMVSCHQDIAGSGVFSLGMIAKFKDVISAAPYHYRHLFWESGMIGQVLYLEAEACGVRGTGIGCFFDDAVHEIMGFSDNHYQSLYHFTIGKPLEDPRLTTYPPYYHLKNR